MMPWAYLNTVVSLYPPYPTVNPVLSQQRQTTSILSLHIYCIYTGKHQSRAWPPPLMMNQTRDMAVTAAPVGLHVNIQGDHSMMFGPSGSFLSPGKGKGGAGVRLYKSNVYYAMHRMWWTIQMLFIRMTCFLATHFTINVSACELISNIHLPSGLAPLLYRYKELWGWMELLLWLVCSGLSLYLSRAWLNVRKNSPARVDLRFCLSLLSWQQLLKVLSLIDVSLPPALLLSVSEVFPFPYIYPCEEGVRVAHSAYSAVALSAEGQSWLLCCLNLVVIYFPPFTQ